MGHTLLIVDDHAAFRAAASSMLAAEGFDVVGEAADGPSAIDAVARLRPSIVILNIQLPGVDGITVAGQLAARPNPPTVVLISSYDASVFGHRLAGAPVRGFLPKSNLTGETLTYLLG